MKWGGDVDAEGTMVPGCTVTLCLWWGWEVGMKDIFNGKFLSRSWPLLNMWMLTWTPESQHVAGEGL